MAPSAFGLMASHSQMLLGRGGSSRTRVNGGNCGLCYGSSTSRTLSAKTVLVQKELQQMHVVARRLSAWLEVAMIAELLRHAYVNS